MTDQVHHDWKYHRLARIIRAAAYADPRTRCARCGRTLEQHPPQCNGRPQRWTAGHKVDGQLPHTLRITDLQPETSTCNSSAGATMGNIKRAEPRTLRWR